MFCNRLIFSALQLFGFWAKETWTLVRVNSDFTLTKVRLWAG